MKFACCVSGEEGANNELLMCVKCKLNFHFKCLYPTDSRSNITSELKKKWICPKCSASGPKRNSDNTPVRCNSGGPSNINTKRGASSHNSSPPSTSGQDYLTTSTEVIRSIISSEVEKLRLELLKSLTDTFSNQLKLIRDDVTKLQEAVNFVNSQHEDMLAKLDKINAEVRPVLNLPSTMNDAIKSIKGGSSHCSDYEDGVNIANKDAVCLYNPI
ncbi:hypothetical protein ACJJTC_007014 [Scirpophaga incertulas]